MIRPGREGNPDRFPEDRAPPLPLIPRRKHGVCRVKLPPAAPSRCEFRSPLPVPARRNDSPVANGKANPSRCLVLKEERGIRTFVTLRSQRPSKFMCAKFEIVSARTIDAKDGFKKHVAYMILVRKDENDNDPVPVIIERRYTDFLELYRSLGQEFPDLISQIYFPRKVFLGNFASDLIKLRSNYFEKFLKAIAGNEKLRDSPRLKLFLTGREEKEARKWLETKCYGQAKPLLENIFRLLSKIHTDRHPSVMIALCRLTACCNADPTSLVDAEKYAALALRRFEGVSDIDLLCYYVPLLQLCIHLWWALGRDKEPLESRLTTLKLHGHRVEGCTPLLESMLTAD